MAFTNAQNTTVSGEYFTDIQGDYNIYDAISVNHSEPGLSELLKVICTGAGFDSEERNPPPRCYPGTRVEILDEVFSWFGTDTSMVGHDGRVLWLHGPAGAGKSAIAQTVCERAATRGDLAASFFFAQGKRDNSAQLFTTIAFQLAKSIPGHRARVEEAIDADPSVIHGAMRTQIQKLIVEPLQVILSHSDTIPVPHPSRPLLIVIDGLNECNGSDAQTQILAQIMDLVTTPAIPLCFMVVSRPEPHIHHPFTKTSLLHLTTEISLHRDGRSREDVQKYLVAEFERMRCSDRHATIFSSIVKPFPSLGDLRVLVRRSNGYFTYASNIIQFLDEEHFSPIDRLAIIIGTSSNQLSPFAELDALYHQILSANSNTALLNQILGVLVWHSEPTLGEIGYLLDLSLEHILLNLRGLHSIISITPSSDGTPKFYQRISAVHKSLCDFLLDAERAEEHYIDFQQIDQHLSLHYVDAMESWTRIPIIRDSPHTLLSIVNHLVTLVCKPSMHVKLIIKRLAAIDSTTWLLLMKHHYELMLNLPNSKEHLYIASCKVIIDIFDSIICFHPDLDYNLMNVMIGLRKALFHCHLLPLGPFRPMVPTILQTPQMDHNSINTVDNAKPDNPAELMSLFQSVMVDMDNDNGSGDIGIRGPLEEEPLIVLECVDKATKIDALVATLEVLFADREKYKQLLACHDSSAQKLLDMFQQLLDVLESPKSTFRRDLIVAMQRLAGKSGLYPTCYEIGDITSVGDYPESSGGFADIYQGTLQGRAVCLKTIRLDMKTEIQHFLKVCSKEAILWGQLSHPNIVPFYGMYRFRRRVSMVAPWMNQGDVNNYLQNHRFADRIQLVFNVAEGLQFLHENGIIHGDLKGPNILVDDSGIACLADFGISSISDSKILAWTSHSSVASKGGSVRWQAPELFDPDGDEDVHNTVASDVYAWSCVTYEIFTEQVPFKHLSRDTAISLRVRQGERPERPHTQSPSWNAWGLTETIWSLMEECWKTNPVERPAVNEIIERLLTVLQKPPDITHEGLHGPMSMKESSRIEDNGSNYNDEVDGRGNTLTPARFREMTRKRLNQEEMEMSVEAFESLLHSG